MQLWSFAAIHRTDAGKSRKTGFSLINALLAAAFIEDPLTGSKYFEAFEKDPGAFKEIRRTLANATNLHRGEYTKPAPRISNKHCKPQRPDSGLCGLLALPDNLVTSQAPQGQMKHTDFSSNTSENSKIV